MHNEFNMKKITSPLLFFLLSREMKFPRIFIIWCRLSLHSFKKNIPKNFPQELIELTALPLWVYINLKKRIGRKKAFEIMRVTILTGGVAKQNILFETIEKERSFKNFIEQEIEINKTGTTKWNTIEMITQDEKKLIFNVTRCQYHELTTCLGIPEITHIVCQIDNAVFNSYLPEKMIFHRGSLNRRISDGAKECHFEWEYFE